ncbi:GNAT family N-acetyltransferase [Halostagnicola kamekurae]|uniref:Acetyltransferase (GNAT) domain-containing protein n=1 Tax=Halostagnicola kamekurae TaxID=619731 RepID=A0A1I6UQJ6_9EURY|nr:GNAT family N-acetyltransferase [Halostagnicola kamekurae]SFT03732.1 Acetyltransferase (GNAT) domain-containing protein [Halostagnicola kamekurae]
MSEPNVQRATAAVAEQLAEVYQSAYQENRRLGLPNNEAESVSKKRIAGLIRKSTVYVAKKGDDVIGGVCLENTDSDRVKLRRLAVHEDWKGEGVGRQLLDYAEEQAQYHGYATIWLITPKAHPYLPEMYRQRGYEDVETVSQENYDFEFLVMEKRMS